MLVVRIPVALRQLDDIDQQSKGKVMFSGPNYTAALVAVSPGPTAGPPATHVGKDVVVTVVDGKGFLRVPGDEIYLERGTVVRIPSGMPHQLEATGPEDLVVILMAIDAVVTSLAKGIAGAEP